MRRHGAATHLLFGELAFALAMTRFQLVKIDAHSALLPRYAEKEILQREIMKHDNAGMFLHRPKNSAVVTIIVAKVI